MKRLGREFFARKPEIVAKDLLGKLLIRQDGSEIKVGKIIETEAYFGLGDKASHSHKGMTKRNEVMFGPAGHAYIYFTYGMHWLLNFITEKEGRPSGVLIRALEPIAPEANINATSGPAKLTKWMSITGGLNKLDLITSEELFVAEEIKIKNKLYKSQKVSEKEILLAPRVGVSYAGEDANLLLRFLINTK